jgi:hypothetical protein
MRGISLGRIGWSLVAAAVLVVGITLSAGSVLAGPNQQNVAYSVTIQNLTSGQPLTPPVVAAHSSQVDVFEVGQAASAEVQAVAENGNADPLLTLLGASDAVFDTATGTAPIMPGESATMTVEAPAGSVLSAIMMLICTNDGFTGVDSLAFPSDGSKSVDANAYDAGTETNTEDFVDIVPPCQDLIGVTSDDAGTGETNPTLAEGGVIAAHAGIQGGTDLTVADHGWTDPVAKITVSAEPSGLPGAGGGPLEGSSGSLWALYALIAGAALLLAGGTVFVVGRRAIQ